MAGVKTVGEKGREDLTTLNIGLPVAKLTHEMGLQKDAKWGTDHLRRVQADLLTTEGLRG